MNLKPNLAKPARNRRLKSHRVLGMLLGVLVFCGNVHGVWSQTLPSWAENEPVMPFTEISRGGFFRAWLVLGRIAKVSQPDREAVVTIDIDHVYAGPAALKGRRFDAHFSKDFYHGKFYELSYLDAFAPGQHLITSVVWRSPTDREANPDDGLIEYSRVYGFPLPTVADGTPQARTVEKHAEAVAAVYQAPAEKRQELMKSYARVAPPLTLLWATAAIGRWPSASKGDEFLKQLAKGKDRSVKQLSVIDQALNMSWNRQNWYGSAERLELLKRFGTTPQTQDGGVQGLSALLTARCPIDVGEVTRTRFLLSIFKSYMDNATISQQSHLEAIKRVTWLLQDQSVLKDDAFTFWTSVLRELRDASIVEACAQELLNNAPWSKEQNQQLQALSLGLETQVFDATTNQAEKKANARIALQKAAAMLAP